MTTFARTWTVSLNNSLATATYTTQDLQAKECLFRRKVLYLAAGWTVVASCDGTTADGTTTDRWVTSANIIWAAPGVAHSWIILKSPAAAIPSSGFQYILLDCATTNPWFVDVWLASTAGFTGLTSTTVKPILNVAPGTHGRQMSGGSFKQHLHSTLVNSKYHTLRSNAGDVLFLVSQDGSGRCHYAGGTFFLANYETGSLFPVFAIESFSESGNGALVHANLNSTTHIAIWNPVTGVAILASATAAGTLLLKTNANTDAFAAIASSGGAVNSEYPRGPLIIGNTGAPICVVGTVVDFALAPNAAQGEEEPKTGTTTSLILGDIWVPNGGVSISM